MTETARARARLPAGVARQAAQRLAEGRGFEQELPDGRLYLDRPLPFLCAHRRPPDTPGDATGQLVQSEGSWLVVSAREQLHEQVTALVNAILEPLADRFGSVMLLEIWAGEDPSAGHFEVVASESTESVEELIATLGGLSFAGQQLDAVLRVAEPAPPGLPPLVSADDVRRLGCLHVGVQVPPLYHDPRTGRRLPEPLRDFRRDLSRALQQAFHAFAQVQTTYSPPHYRTLGRRVVTEPAWEADRQLAEVGGAFDFLMAVTPVNTAEAWAEFERHRYQREPAFHYRLLNVDPETLKRRLYSIPIAAVPDPTLAYLFRDKRAELDRKITLLADRETERFLPGSVALYGGVDDGLHDLAERILAGLPADVADRAGDMIDAQAFARAARAELDRLVGDQAGEVGAAVEVRDDVPSLIVSGATLMVGSSYEVRPGRVDALIQHEVGTHVLTFCNGRAQPLRQLAHGLAGYEQLQEGLAVLAEHLVGGLNAGRLRLLAARVVAVRRLVDGSSFTETFHELHTYGLAARQAFQVTMRVFRSGGLTKDAVYLRGLAALVEYLAAGGDLGVLTLGKFRLEQVPLVEELRWRQILAPPLLRPAWLERPDALQRLELLRDGRDVLDLIEGSSA